MRQRSKARETTLQLLYQIEISKQNYKDVFPYYIKENSLTPEMIEFSTLLIEGVLNNITKIDFFIKTHVKNWEIDRMAVIDRNILRIACFELIYLEEVPPKVAINEGIELAKKYGDIDSPRFVNGVLDKIYKVHYDEDKRKTEKVVK